MRSGTWRWPGGPLVYDLGVGDDPPFSRLARAVYLGARAGMVDCEAAFDLAVAQLAVSPLDPDATELARLSLEGAKASQPRMAGLAFSLLAAVGFDPGFTDEPGWLSTLQDAMEQVNRDVAASGISRPCQLHVRDGQAGVSGNAYVETGGGYTSATVGILPASGADPVPALLAVAGDAQDALMEEFWSVWPVCPIHGLGAHARDRDKTAVWWCAGDDGHAVAAIGRWPGR